MLRRYRPGGPSGPGGRDRRAFVTPVARMTKRLGRDGDYRDLPGRDRARHPASMEVMAVTCAITPHPTTRSIRGVPVEPNPRTPLPVATAAAELRSVGETVRMVRRQHIHIPLEHVGMRLRFADDATGRVYRDTAVDGAVPANPWVLLVMVRLWFQRGRGHDTFQAESILNAPLFVGFPVFVSKLWLAHDEHGAYCSFYERDGPLSSAGKRTRRRGRGSPSRWLCRLPVRGHGRGPTGGLAREGRRHTGIAPTVDLPSHQSADIPRSS